MAYDLVAGLGGGGGIKSVQRGYDQINAAVSTTLINVTITAVDLSKSFVSASNTGIGNGTSSNAKFTYRLTSTTNLELRRSGTTGSPYVAWEVIEFG